MLAKKNRHKIVYPNIPSAIRPAPLSKEVPILIFKGLPSFADKDIGHDTKKEGSCDNELPETEWEQSEECSSETQLPLASTKPLHQTELNDLILDLRLSKKEAELLASK